MYLAIPLSKWKQLQDHHNSKPPVPVQQEQEVALPPSPPVLGKNVIKEVRGRQVNKLLNLLETYKGQFDFENIQELVADCLARNTRRTLDNEKDFYLALFATPLAQLVRNRTKIDRYHKKPLFFI